jgi:6-phosphogluconolactonase
MVLLGLGEDGHTASLFPGPPVTADAPVMAVTANYGGRPAGRVTLTPLVFNDARHVTFIVSGANKADAVYNTFYTDDPVRYPARRVRYVDDMDPMWFLDKGAARRLDWRGHRPPRH